MSRYKDMRDAIVAILGDVQVGDAPAIQEVATAPKDQFEKTPAATVVPAEVGSELHTTVDNLRSYGFNIHLHYPLNEDDSWETAINDMLDLVDATLDALDGSGNLGGLAHVLEAAPLEWDVAKSGDNLQLLATIHTVAKVSVDV